jgi:hypothetical protein
MNGAVVTCGWCGKPVPENPVVDGVDVYCSQHCHDKWADLLAIWRQPPYVDTSKRRKRTCPYCGQEFEALRRNTESCSTSRCRMRAYRKRRSN